MVLYLLWYCVFALLVMGLSALIFARWTCYVLILRVLGKAPSCPLRCLLPLEAQMKERQARCARLVAQLQLIDREGGLCLWKAPEGSYWMPDRPLSGSSLADMLAEQTFDHYGGARHGVRRGDTVIDCGANVGVFTRMALQSGARLVLAIEPSPATAASFKRNFAAEIAAGQVLLYEGGVWSSETVLAMNMGDSPAGDSVLSVMQTRGKDRHTGATVPVTTIDRLVYRFDLRTVDFIKMDIEGAEREALAGATDTITRFLPRLGISAYHLPDDPVCIRRVIQTRSAQYRCYFDTCVMHFNGYRHSRVSPEVFFFSAEKPSD